MFIQDILAYVSMYIYVDILVYRIDRVPYVCECVCFSVCVCVCVCVLTHVSSLSYEAVLYM